jgi:tetratricopeptide (TPR) repeat protein
MTRQEAEQVAEAICNRRHRKIGAEVLDAIASRWGGGPDAPGGGINPLWLELAVEELNLLDADDFARMEHEFADLHPAERQQRLWLEKAAQLPASVEELYDWMLTRTERLNRDWSIALSTLLAVGRSGWREGDLRALLPAITDERWKTVPFGSKGWRDLHLSGEAWQDLLFAILRRGFLGHLVQRGTLMQWDFRHAQMRTAVRRRHLAGPALLRHLHGTVARYLESLPADDPLRQSELMFHWIEADEPERAARLFAEDLPPPALEGATQALAARAREGLTAEGVHPGLDWVLDLLHEPTLSDGTRARLCLRYISVLRQAVEQDLPPQTMAAFLGKVEAKLRDMAESDPRDPNWSLAWAYVSDEVGQCLVEVGRLGEALAVFKKSLAIRLRLTAARPGDTLAARALALSHARIAEPLRRTGRLKEARESLESALSIRESLAQKDPDNLSLQAELAKTLEDLGSVNQDLGDLASARQKYEAALLIRGQLAARKEPFQYGCVDSGADRLVGLSASHIGLGEVLQAQGDLHGALDQLHSARKARQQLLDSDPRNVTCQRDLAVAHIKVGMVQQVLGCLSAAAESFRNAAALRERLARLDPTRLDREYDLAVSRCSLGGALHDQGDLDGALAAFEAYRSGMERLVQLAPSNYEWLRERWRSEVKIGEVLRSKRDFRGAYEAYHRNLEGVQSLVKQFPHNAESRHELAAAHNYIGFALQGMGDHEGALESYRAYRQGMEELVRLDPSNKTWRRDLIATHACLGAAYLALGDPEKAQSEYREFTEEMERLLETSPDNASWRRDLAVGYGRIADLFQRQGRLDEALSVRLECHDTFASLAEPDPSNAIAQRDLAVSFCALAQLCGERMEPALAEQNLQRCLLILTGMEEAGMYLDDPLRALLEDYERN